MKLRFLVLIGLVFVGGCEVQDMKDDIGGHSDEIGGISTTASIEIVGDDEVELGYLSDEEYVLAEGNYLGILRDEDRGVALAELRRDVRSDGKLAGSCHSIVHAIGHEAYEKYGDFGEAMSFQDEICNSGYLHGILEEHFSGVDDVESELLKVCDGYKEGSYLAWQCYHGVGHGVMFYTDNDLPEALGLCDVYGEGDARSSCVNGVFMENFNADQVAHQSDYVDFDNPYAPCEIQQDGHKRDCYTYAPVFWLAAKGKGGLNSGSKDVYEAVVASCMQVEEDWKGTCSFGVGVEVMKQNIGDAGFVEDICGSGGFVKDCVQGMAVEYLFNSADLLRTKTMCMGLEGENVEWCLEAVDWNAGYF